MNASEALFIAPFLRGAFEAGIPTSTSLFLIRFNAFLRSARPGPDFVTVTGEGISPHQAGACAYRPRELDELCARFGLGPCSPLFLPGDRLNALTRRPGGC